MQARSGNTVQQRGEEEMVAEDSVGKDPWASVGRTAQAGRLKKAGAMQRVHHF